MQRRKRARISAGKQPARSRADRETSEPSTAEESDVDMDDESEGQPDVAATQYDMLRDAGFKHLKHADEDDKRATQRLQQKGLSRQSNRADAVVNHAADNGILESIQCVNFMCHDNLYVELGPLLNFIVGENGSGKSAILTAITLCLGGKASSTNRGGSLKSFIKEGRDKSKLIVKIKNKGNDAYQHETFGDTILVERHFSRAGTSGFYVKSDTGRTISNKKRDVDEIVEYYCLQVDNPLNVLSQDNARQFLNAASAKTKYRFFVQGVQLQQLDDDYRVIEEYLNANEHKEGDLQTKVEVSLKEYEKAKREYKILQQSEKMRDELRLLSHKSMWAQVIEKERELAERERLLAEAEQGIGEAQAVLETRTVDLANIDQKIERLVQALKDLHEENSTLEASKGEAKTAHDDAKAELSRLQSDQRSARSKLESSTNECKDLESKIETEKQRLEESNGDVITRKTEELEAARAQLVQKERDIEDAKKRQPGLQEKQSEIRAEGDKIDRTIADKTSEIQTTQARIREIVAGQGSLYDAYEPNMRSLLRMIDADAGFERKPIGPIGAHIQVLEPAWCPMLEQLFGASLNGFVVISKRDQLRLNDMMNRANVKQSPILIGNAHPIDTSRSEPDKLYTTILRILKIDDPLIRNQLIINNRIEKTILVQSKADADRIMLGSALPQNVTACYHPLPSKGPGWTVRVTVNANGANSTPTKPPHLRQKPRLQSDSQQEKVLHEERLRQSQGELKALEAHKTRLQQSQEESKKEIGKCKASIDRMIQDRRKIQSRIQGVQGELEEFEGVDGKLHGLQAMLETAKEALEQYESEYGFIGLKKEEKYAQCEQLYGAMKAASENVKEFDAQRQKAQDKIDRAKSERSMILTAKHQAFDDHASVKIQRNRHKDKRDSLEQIVTDWTAKAQERCERVEIWETETHEIIQKKLESLHKTLQERERRRGMTDEEVSQRAQQAMIAYTSIKKAYEQVREDNKALKYTLNQRLKRWRLFQRYISSTSRANFMYLLTERDFRGRLILDHKNHTLEVQVEPDKTRKNAAARNTKTLSGGEKSFSSICLLLAIWEAMGSPLRCLDEFDVFMDNVNRRISTDMLVRVPCVQISGVRSAC